MSTKTTQWILEFIDKITSPVRAVKTSIDSASDAMNEVTEKTTKFGECLRRLRKRALSGMGSRLVRVLRK